MADLDVTPKTSPVIGVVASQRSTVAAILQTAGQGLFTAIEADMLIDWVRVLVTASSGALPIASSLSVEDGRPCGHDRYVLGVPHQSG